MIFDQPPGELPVATVVPRDRKTRVRAAAIVWLSRKWRWLRPRSIPMVVAFAGMLAVVGSASYLRDFARRAPEQLPSPAPLVVTTVDVERDAVPDVAVPPSRCGVAIVPRAQ